MTNMPPTTTRVPTVYRGTASRVPPLRPYFRRLFGARALIGNLARTNLKARHYDTALGQLWLILGPLLLAGVYLLLRLVLRPAGSAEEAKAIVAQMVMGVFVFQFVSGVIVGGGSSILNNKGLLLNSSTPRMVYPAVGTAEQAFDLGTMLVVLFAIRLVLQQPFTAWLLVLPVVLVLLAVFSFGLALMAATAAVYFRDTVNLLTYVTRVWLFVTPVLYTVDEIPENMRKFMAINPLYPFFAVLDAIFNGVRPQLGYLVWCAGWAAVALVLGLWYFLVKERDFALRIY